MEKKPLQLLAVKSSHLAPDFLFAKEHETFCSGLFTDQLGDRLGRPVTSANEKITEPAFFLLGKCWLILGTVESRPHLEKNEREFAGTELTNSSTQERMWSWGR